MKKLIYSLILAVSFILVACDKKSGNEDSSMLHQYRMVNGTCWDYTANTYAAPNLCSATNSYYYTNGVCYLATTNQPVDVGLCSMSTTNGYTYSNGYCYSSNGQVVPTNYCSTGSSTNQCYGTYIYNSNGYMQQVSCNGANCRGYTLIEQSTGRQVTCQ